MAIITASCTNSTEALRPALHEQIGGEQRCFVASALTNTGNPMGERQNR
jgi:hypothetical protein